MQRLPASALSTGLVDHHRVHRGRSQPTGCDLFHARRGGRQADLATAADVLAVDPPLLMVSVLVRFLVPEPLSRGVGNV
jgi:hypothetical protein